MSCDRYSYQVMYFGVYFSEYKYFSSFEAGNCWRNFQLQKRKKMLQTIQHQKGLLVFTLFCLIYILCIFVILSMSHAWNVDPMLTTKDAGPTLGQHWVKFRYHPFTSSLASSLYIAMNQTNQWRSLLLKGNVSFISICFVLSCHVVLLVICYIVTSA